MKNLALILLAFCCGSGEAEARNPVTRSTATLRDFCESPFKVICGKKGGPEKARAGKIEELRAGISGGAWEQVLKKFPQAGDLETWEALMEEVKEGKHTLDSREKKIASLYFVALYDGTRKLLGSAFASSEQSFFRVRDFMMPKVRERLSRSAATEAEAMLSELSEKKLRFANFLDLVQGPPGDPDFFKEIITGCGRDGMQDNAFAITGKTDGLNYVLVCPGSFVADFVPGRFREVTENDSFGQIWTIGHETGHHIDSREYPRSYEKLSECLNQNYGKELKLGAGGIAEYMSEISADYWGTEALVDYLGTLGSDMHKLIVLQENLEGLCGAEDDGGEVTGEGHPSAKFRIERMTRQNPRLHEVLGCAPKPAEKAGISCTLRGAWRKKFW